jgi:hypothetical protein
MARGYPDYQNPVNKVAGRLVDFSAIVVSQLGVSPLDGLGRLAWFDKFHDNLSAWWIILTHPDTFAVISTDVSEVPPSCAKLTPGLSGGGCGASLFHTSTYTEPSPTGLEVSMRVNVGDAYITMGYDLFYNGTHYSMYVQYYALARQIILQSAIPDFVIYTLPVSYRTGTWLTIKLVVDWIGQKGVRLLIGDLFFDLSAYAVRAAPSVFLDSLSIYVGAHGLSAAAIPQYLGHVYFTMDEP